jgi:hypothetical protein
MQFIPQTAWEGAQNVVLNWAQVKRGQSVLLLNEIGLHNLEDEAVFALTTVAQQAGAQVQIMWTDRIAGGEHFGKVPAPVVRAFEAADIVFVQHETIGNALPEIANAIEHHGTVMILNRVRSIAAMRSPWARFPASLYGFIEGHVMEQLMGTKSVRITTDLGTDIVGESLSLLEGEGTVIPRQDIEAGEVKKFLRKVRKASIGNTDETFEAPITRLYSRMITTAGGQHAEIYGRFNGVISTQTTSGGGQFIRGMPQRFREPMKITVKDGVVTKFEGGSEAAAYQKAMETLKQQSGLPDAQIWVYGYHAGISHKSAPPFDAYTKANPAHLHFHLGVGAPKIGGETTGRQGNVNLDCDNATVIVDSGKLYDRGKLLALQDPAVIEEARKYGDPELLLEQARPSEFTGRGIDQRN